MGTTLKATTVDGRARNVGVMRELTMPTLHTARAAGRESPFVRTGRRRDPNDPDGRSSQMLFFSARCRDRDRNAGARPMATSHVRVTKQHDAAVNTEKTQTARMKNDPKSFFLCPYNYYSTAKPRVTTPPSDLRSSP
jgi:hypothetical protein